MCKKRDQQVRLAARGLRHRRAFVASGVVIGRGPDQGQHQADFGAELSTATQVLRRQGSETDFVNDEQPTLDTAARVGGRPPASRPGGWPWWGWVLLLLCSVVGFVGTAIVGLFIVLQAAAVCDEPLRRAAIATAQRELMALVAVVAIPWMVALWRLRHRVWVSVAALLSVAPVVYLYAWGTASPGDVYRFCIPF